MKLFNFLLLFTTILILQTPLLAKQVVVNGTIENVVGKEIIFIEYGMPFNFEPNNKVKINDDGTFTANLEIAEDQYFYISYMRQNVLLFLSPNKEISLKFEGKKLPQTLEFSGDLSDINTHLLKRQGMEKSIPGRIKGMYAKDWTTYKEYIDEIKKNGQSHLDEFKNGKKIKKGTLATFVKLEQANIDGIWGTYYTQYPSHHAHYAKKNPAEIWPLIDLAKAEILVKDDESLLASKSYRDFLNQFLFSHCDLDFATAGEKITSRAQFVSKVYFKIDDKIEYPWLQDYLRARSIYEQVDKYGLSEMLKPVEDFRTRSKIQENYKTAIDKAWNKWESTMPGAQAPDIVGKDIDGNEIKLSDFKGKWVYVDVWATWCGPCRKEIPHLKKAEEALHGKDVVFLSVSTDDGFSKWKDFVIKNELGGVQINIPGGWSSKICKDYNISSIPRFMLIDKEGKIVNVQTIRPSQGITALLQKKLMEN